MLPLISSFVTDLAGLPGDSTAELPVSGDSGGQFAGILKQSVTATPPAVQGLPSGNGLPPGGKILPVDFESLDLPALEIDWPVDHLFDPAGPGAATAGSESLLTGLAPKPMAQAISTELAELAAEAGTDIGLPMDGLSEIERPRLQAAQPVPIDALADPAVVVTVPAINPEAFLRDRQGQAGFEASPGASALKRMAIASSPANLLSMGAGSEQRAAVSPQVAEPASLTAAMMYDRPTVAVAAGKLAAESFIRETVRAAGSAIESPAVNNGSSLSGQFSIAGTAAPGLTTGTPAGAASMHIGTPLHHAAWSNELGSRVLLMTGQQLQSAKIQLSPADLGPITVSLVVDDGSADLTFHAQHGLTRDAIEQALPRLREMLNDNGLTLGNATVSDQGVPKDGSGRASEQARGLASSNDQLAGREDQPGGKTERVLQGLLDTFV